MRPTLNDVAREAGVSSATVDRVLNQRIGVSDRTRSLVLDTANRLGYFRSAETSTERLQLDFILPEGTNSFIRSLKWHLEKQCAASEQLDARFHAVESFNPFSLAQKLLEMKTQSRGVGLIALDHPAVREAIRTLADAGVTVVTLVSDILHVPRAGYIGVDNRAAGRLGGYLIGRLLPRTRSKVALFAGSLSYRGHEEREMGFRHIISEEFPHLEFVELREVRDDPRRAYEEASSLLERYPDLAGIYNIGAGNTGIGQALSEHSRKKSVVFIGHELTEDSKPLLISGVIDALIDQNPRVEAREAISMLTHTILGTPLDYHAPRLQVVFRENIPEN